MAKVLHDVQVERQDGLPAVGPESVELVKNRNLCDVVEGCGVRLAHVYLYDIFARCLTKVAADWLRPVGIQDIQVFLGVVAKVIEKPVPVPQQKLTGHELLDRIFFNK